MAKFDYNKEYGVVLEGGGAKGAYQIGVWRAMKECGVKIKGVSGVSVGALNGALICMDDIEKAENIWENICYSQVMKVDNEQMDHLMNLNLKQLDLKQLTKLGVGFLADRGFDVTPLRKLIDETVDVSKINNSKIELFIGTFSMNAFKEVEVALNQMSENELKDYLLASAYFPAFKNEKLHGKKYMDGGVINNVPVDLLIKNGYKDIIVVRIFGIGYEKRTKIPEDAQVIQIAPRIDLGNILEFNNTKCKRNMKIGYYDGMRCFKNLKGYIYYIDSELTDEQCLQRFTRSNEFVQMAFLEYYHLDYADSSVYVRGMLEKVLPMIADELKLPKHWGYEELFLSMLELCAKYVKVPKYNIYTVNELILKIKDKYTELKKKEPSYRLPVFVDLVMNLTISLTNEQIDV